MSRVLAVGLLLSVVTLLSMACTGSAGGAADEQALLSAAEREVPPGSSVGQVIAFLATQTPDHEDTLQLDGTITGTVLDLGGHGIHLVELDVILTARFDRRKHLTAWTAHHVLTGL